MALVLAAAPLGCAGGDEDASVGRLVFEDPVAADPAVVAAVDTLGRVVLVEPATGRELAASGAVETNGVADLRFDAWRRRLLVTTGERDGAQRLVAVALPRLEPTAARLTRAAPLGAWPVAAGLLLFEGAERWALAPADGSAGDAWPVAFPEWIWAERARGGEWLNALVPGGGTRAPVGELAWVRAWSDGGGVAFDDVRVLSGHDVRATASRRPGVTILALRANERLALVEDAGTARQATRLALGETPGALLDVVTMPAPAGARERVALLLAPPLRLVVADLVEDGAAQSVLGFAMGAAVPEASLGQSLVAVSAGRLVVATPQGVAAVDVRTRAGAPVLRPDAGFDGAALRAPLALVPAAALDAPQ
jgi:hypothetical protein